MFCSKCGAKVIDGAVFCGKCGAKLIPDNIETQLSVPVSTQQLVESPAESSLETTQEENSHEESSCLSGNDTDIFTILAKNTDMCPAIKSGKRVKKGGHLQGKIYNYAVRFIKKHTDQIRIHSALKFPLSILYALPIGLLCYIIWIIVAELIKYGSICIEYYHGILFSALCLVTATVMLFHSFAGRKEKAAVSAYVREITELRNISLSAEKKTGMSKIRIAAAVVLVLAGIIILLFNLPAPLKYPDELLFDGLPATRFLEMTQKDVEAEFGKPDSINHNLITGDEYYTYSHSIINDVTYSKETGKVIYIKLAAYNCSCNRKRLDKSLDRVEDILHERYRGYYSYDIYGSIHNGFYYDDVYFGETPSAKDIQTLMEFEDKYEKDGYTRFYPLRVYEPSYDSEQSIYWMYPQDYKIDLIYYVHDRFGGVYNVCIYTDEWLESIERSRVQADENEKYTVDEQFDYEDEKYTTNEQFEDVNLSKTYVNEDEGFSFMYPEDWEIENAEEMIPESLVSVACTGIFYINARIAVTKGINDGSYFAATELDFEELFSSEKDMNNVKIMALSDAVLDGCSARKLTISFDNDLGTHCIEVIYLYIRNSYVYAVFCATEEANYDKYEPIFNAIMDTYTITAANTAEEDIVPYDVYDQEAALQNMLDWFERHPLQHNIRIRFMEEAVDGGNGSGKYLKYELDMAEELDTAYELYGSFYVNPDNGDMVMESTTGGWERIKSVQVPMDQWYLEYYWGWTDDSGYYTESYNESSYTIYDDMDYELLEYHGEDDTYVICNSDTVYFIEYDGSPTASEISIDDFTGLYLCDQSFEMEGQYVGNEYLLDIGKVEYNSFSITESWRGIDFLQDDYAQPRMLIENTLYFTIYNSESGCYETHYLTYTPAQNSPLGKDMVYLDGDDSMPFEKE